MGWFQLASHLKMSVQRCKRETTSEEFAQWMWFLRNEMNNSTKLDYYLATIIYAIFRSQSDSSFRMKPEDFLLKFKFESKTPPPMTVEERTSFWKKFFYALTSTGKNRAKP